MKSRGFILLLFLFAFIAVPRLPAPIQETQETPSPSPTPPASATPSRQEAARFVGTWTGKIKFGRFGDVDFMLVVNPAANSLIQKSRFGQLAHPTNVSAGTLSWAAGEKSDHAWTLTPNPDGQTAMTTLKLPSGVESTATFQRVEPKPKRNALGTRTKARP